MISLGMAQPESAGEWRCNAFVPLSDTLLLPTCSMEEALADKVGRLETIEAQLLQHSERLAAVQSEYDDLRAQAAAAPAPLRLLVTLVVWVLWMLWMLWCQLDCSLTRMR